MSVVLSKEAELKEQVGSLKAKVSGLDQQNVVLSKQLGEAQKVVARVADLEAALEQAKKDLANAQSQAAAARAESASLQANALKAERVLEVARGLKSLLASV